MSVAGRTIGEGSTGTSGAGTGSPSLSRQIGDFAAGATFDRLPTQVVHRAKLLLLDATGVAIAASTFDFARRTADALTSMSSGTQPVIGLDARLALRDAALLNGVLIHGLDFDDTHVTGVVHVSASALPAALGVAVERHLSGADLLLGYVLGIEVAARVGAAAGGGMHRAGFHPTGVAGAFGAAVAAGKLTGLDAAQLADAQGVALSFAAGSMQFVEEGAETKRLHPGWAAAAGITAVALARHGVSSPQHPYDGGQGLYRSHLREGDGADLSRLTAALGEQWQIDDVAVKLHPSCHFTHAFIEAAVHLAIEHDIDPGAIERITCPIHDDEVPVVCEPRDRKVAPGSDYEAKFSLPYAVAASLVHRRFTLGELDADVRRDERVLDVARRVAHCADPASAYPRAYSGEVIVHMNDGRALRHRVQINLGSQERPVAEDDIVAKFLANVRFAEVEQPAGDRIVEAVMSLDACGDAGALGEMLAALPRVGDHVARPAFDDTIGRGR